MAVVCSIIDTPTNISTTLVAGGSLKANTTYYYVMFAQDSNYLEAASIAIHPLQSEITAEGSFTTDSTNLSVKFNWDNIAGTGRKYGILISETSGDYTSSSVAGQSTAEYGTNWPDDGVAGYTITAEPSFGDVCHSCQLVNGLAGDIPKNTGTLLITIDGDTGWSAATLYTQIVGQGFGDYVYWDSTHFVLKGWIYTPYLDTTSIGYLTFSNIDVTFIKGGIHARATNFVIKFGLVFADNQTASPLFGVNIDIQTPRYAFCGQTDNSLKVYGCTITKGDRIKTSLAENLRTTYYYGSANAYIGYNMTNWKGNISAYYGRNNSSNLSDSIYGQGNNWSGYQHTRLQIIQTANLNYGKCYFYACNWKMKEINQTQKEFTFYEWKTPGREDIANFYDNTFPTYPDGVIKYPYAKWRNLTETFYTSIYHMDFYYTIKIKILDIDGNPVEGVNVNCVNKDSENVTWVEKDGTVNEWTSGTVYTEDVLTDSNGEIDYYILAYDVRLNPDAVYVGDTNYDTVNTYFYPFTLTFSKEGYRDYSIKILEHITRNESTITLEPVLNAPTTIHNAVIHNAIIH